MKKILLMLAVVSMSVQSAYSQNALVESKSSDNWYVGINGGLNSKIINNDSFFGNLNPSVGLRVGRYWTPVAGWLVAGDFYFGDKQFDYSNASTLKGASINLMGTLNLSNWFGGYQGEPRDFELIALGGLGWHHTFNNKKAWAEDLVSRFGLDFAFNMGSDKEWQLYVEPALNYNMTQDGRARFNLNTAAFQLSVGLNYKFGNSNGTHNFKYSQLRDQSEIDDLNLFINELKAEVSAKDKRIAQDIRRISDLMDSLDVAKKTKPATVINKVVNKVVNNNVLQPTVIFGQGKSSVDAAQMASVAMIAKYMKNHPD